MSANVPDSLVGRAGPDLSPTEALAFLWRRRWSIGALSLLAAAGGAFYAQQRGTIWRARSVLYVERDSPVMPGGDISYWLRSRNYANTQAALLRSTPILQAGLAQPGIDSSGVFGESNNHLAWLKRSLTIAVVEEDDLITVSLDSSMVEQACEVVNAVVGAYLTFHAKTKRDSATSVFSNLTTELERHEAELRTVQHEQVKFLTEHPGVGASATATNVAVERLHELNAALTRAELEALEAETSWRAAKSMADSPGPFLPLDGTAAAPRTEPERLQRLHDLRQRSQQLLAEATPEHPEAQRLSAMIAELEHDTATENSRMANAYVEMLQRRYQGLRQKCDGLATRIADQEKILQDVAPAQAEYRAIELRFDRVNKMVDSLYERVRAININENLDTANKQERDSLVYEYATPAGAIVTSSKKAIVAIAAFLGLIAGIGLAWLRSLVDQGLRTPEDSAARGGPASSRYGARPADPDVRQPLTPAQLQLGASDASRTNR
ncbi:MAG TPA: hypothetical protein VK348_04425 [Planctomycetota bacterium]|nr:hypothetical protein [Planctomycetota bacterium]